MVDVLMAPRRSVGWRWGERRSGRAQLFVRFSRALRDEALRPKRRQIELAQVLKPRVQPLFLLVPKSGAAGGGAGGGGGGDGDGGDSGGPLHHVKYTVAGQETQRCLIWVCLPGKDKAKVTFKYRYSADSQWNSHSGVRNRGNGWWTNADGWDYVYNRYEHSVWIDDGLVYEGIDTPDADQFVDVPADGTFPTVKGSLVADSAQASMAAVHDLLQRSQPVLKYHLSKIVFPAHMRFQKQKISVCRMRCIASSHPSDGGEGGGGEGAMIRRPRYGPADSGLARCSDAAPAPLHVSEQASGNDLGGDLVFPKRIGFTGTPSDLLPQAMGKCGFREGTEGEMVHTLTELRMMRPVVLRDSLEGGCSDWDSTLLLDMIARSHPTFEQPLHALIDTGALITGLSNKEVAIHLIEAGLPLDGVVYLGDEDVKMIYEKKGGRAIKLEDSLIPLERRFCFYDQARRQAGL